MRRLLLSFLLLLFCYCLPASPVGAERARSVAKTFLGVRPTGSNNRALSMKVRGTNIDAPAYYVFNLEGGGFVIVSGDDAVTPILGYSRTGCFETEDMPDNLASWMEGLEKSILEASSSGTPPSEKTLRQWKKLESGWFVPSLAGEKVLETALWNQRDPFNRYCPVIDGRRTPSGCVATAGAIIMRYHQYPEKGVGTLDGYDYTTLINDTKRSFHVNGHNLGHKYVWEKMPLTYESESFTLEDARQVAQLMWDIGVMSHMKYSPNESSANPELMIKGFVDSMGYDTSILLENRYNHSYQEWISLLIDEIDNNRPVLFSGHNPLNDSSHAFVCDGYDKDGLLHINWGWGGRSNGFFLLDEKDYSDFQLAWVGIKPNPGGSVSQKVFFSHGITADAGHPAYHDFGPGTKLSISTGVSYRYPFGDSNTNTGDISFSGYIAIGKYSSDGQLLKVVSDAKDLVLIDSRPTFVSFQVLIQEDYLPGEYLVPCISTDGISWSAPDDRYSDISRSAPDRYYGDISLYYVKRLVICDLAALLKNTSFTYSRSKQQIRVATPVQAVFAFRSSSSLSGWSETTISDNYLIDTSQLGEHEICALGINYPGMNYILMFSL
jgi:hypothetical protein